MVVMAAYIHRLELPNNGLTYDYGMAFVIVNWVVLDPFAAIVLHCALKSPRYEKKRGPAGLPTSRRNVYTVNVVRGCAWWQFVCDSGD